jgi:PAT family beta-lactamase induction signal transducer AmpG
MTTRKHPPPWMFVFAGTSYGVTGAFISQIMPFLTSHNGIDKKSIGWFTTLLFVPAATQFLYSPIVDVGPPRRKWLVIVAILSALCLVGAFSMPLPGRIHAFLAFAFAAQVLSALIGACAGGLLAVTMPDEKRGAGSAWYNVGNLSGGGAAGAVAIYLTGEGWDPTVVGLVIAAMLTLPALAILFIYEPPRDNIQSVGEVFGQSTRDIRSVLFSRAGLTGIALCISPIGTAALTNFFSDMGDDFHASTKVVAFGVGGASSIVTAIGALIGGYLCDRFNRRAMYLLSGALTAICGVALAKMSHTPTTYLVGVTSYNLVTGFCYSAFTATVLETIGNAGKAASTQYALFVSAGNIAIQYVGLADTRFADIDGQFLCDAALNLAGVAVLAFVFWKLGSFGKRSAELKAQKT